MGGKDRCLAPPECRQCATSLPAAMVEAILTAFFTAFFGEIYGSLNARTTPHLPSKEFPEVTNKRGRDGHC
jgi:hypothetical protein